MKTPKRARQTECAPNLSECQAILEKKHARTISLRMVSTISIIDPCHLISITDYKNLPRHYLPSLTARQASLVSNQQQAPNLSIHITPQLSSAGRIAVTVVS
jgi:hypothetical protein